MRQVRSDRRSVSSQLALKRRVEAVGAADDERRVAALALPGDAGAPRARPSSRAVPRSSSATRRAPWRHRRLDALALGGHQLLRRLASRAARPSPPSARAAARAGSAWRSRRRRSAAQAGTRWPTATRTSFMRLRREPLRLARRALLGRRACCAAGRGAVSCAGALARPRVLTAGPGRRRRLRRRGRASPARLAGAASPLSPAPACRAAAPMRRTWPRAFLAARLGACGAALTRRGRLARRRSSSAPACRPRSLRGGSTRGSPAA